MKQLYTFTAISLMLSVNAFSQCINTHNTSAASTNVCYGDSTNINLDGSEDSVLYWVRDENTQIRMKPPIHGDGNPLSYNTGALTQNKTYSYSGQLKGGALDFDGSNDYDSIAFPYDLSASNMFTIEAWVNPSDINTMFDYMILAQNSSVTSTFELFFDNTGTTLSFLLVTPGSPVTVSAAITPADFENKWNHIAGTYDGTNLKLYINGQLKGTMAQTGNLGYSPTQKFFIGADPVLLKSSYMGKIDEVRLWNTARTTSQININMYRELQGSENGLAAYWNLEDGTGSGTAADVTGGNNGTLTNMDPATDWVIGSIGKSGNYGGLDFDGVDDYVDIPGVLINPAIGFTIETWAYTNFDNIYQTVVAKTNGTFPEPFQIQFTDMGRIEFQAGQSGSYAYTQSGFIQDSTWYHIAGVWDPGVSEVRLYINGIPVDTTSFGGGVTDGVSNMSIGGRSNGTQLFSGMVDEVRVWNNIRTLSQIQDNMFYKLTSTQNGLVGYWALDDGTGSGSAIDGSPSKNNGTLTNMDPPSDWVGGIVRGENCSTMMNGYANVSVTGSDTLAFLPADSAMICPGSSINFNFNSYPYDSLLWDFGDGQTGMWNYVPHTYNDTGTYIVKMWVYSSMCGWDSATQTVFVDSAATPIFSINGSDEACPNDAVSFSSSSPLSSYLWIFDGTDTLTNANPAYTWTATGTYTVALEGTNNCGNASQDTFFVNVNNSVKIVNANINLWSNPSCPLEPVNFSNNNNDPGTYWWYFGDGDSSNVKNPIHYYADTGTYAPMLIITNSCGYSDTVNPSPTTLTIQYDTTDIPNAYFRFDINGSWPGPDTLVICPGQSINFENMSYGNNGSTIIYLWDFGDGGTATTYDAMHQFDSINTFTVRLISTNLCGGKDTATKWVKVNPAATPGSSLSILPFDPSQPNKVSICPNEMVLFYDDKSPFGNYLYSVWFGDGDSLINVMQSKSDSTFGVAMHTYQDTGAYNYVFISTNLCGNNDTLSGTITVDTVSSGMAFIFHDGDDSLSPACPGDELMFWTFNGVSILWDFGDGSPIDSGDVSINGHNALHAYSAVGTYTVMAIITNGCGGTDTANSTVYINSTNIPDPWFDSDQPNWTACAGENVNFTGGLNGGGGDNASYFWDFDDGATDTVRNPAHIFISPGSYFIKLTATNGCGSKTTNRTLTVRNVIINETSLSITNSACGDSTGSVTGLIATGVPPFTFIWNNANGDTVGNSANVNNQPAGFYTLYAYDLAGCWDTSGAHQILNTGAPAAPSAPSPSAYCQGDAISDLTATAGSGGILKWYSDPALSDSIFTGSPFASGASTGTSFYVTETVGVCESPFTQVNITVNPVYNIPLTAVICSGDSILLGGNYQTSAGTYYDTLLTTMSCDSVIATTLTVNPIYNIPASASICSGDSILLGGAYRLTAGTYYDTLSTTLSCDSVIITTLTVNPIYNIPASASICSGDSILLGGAYRLTAGTYYDTLLTTLSCDSVIATTLTVNPIYNIPASAAICSGDSILLGGTYQSTAGTYYDTLSTTLSCDSVIITTLTINPTYNIPASAFICTGDSILLGGAYQSTAGTYYDTLSTTLSCDSVIITALTVNQSYTGSMSTFIPASICSGDSILLGGNYQVSAGTYYDTLSTTTSCDSVIVTALTVNPTYNIPASAAICSGDSILLGGNYQSTAGTYYDTLSTTLSCDSVIITTLTVNPTYTVPTSTSICSGDSILLGGIYQISSGTYYDTLSTAMSCDSIIATTLIVNPSYLTPVSTSICSGDSIKLGGMYQTTTGTYYDTLSTIMGCDSVIKIMLIVNPTYTVSASASICSGDSILLGGAYQISAGTYYDTLSTTMSCDSVIVTTLTVNPTYTIPASVSICSGDSILLGGTYRLTAGTYYDTLSTTLSCDSVIATMLTVNPLPVINISPSPGVVCNLGDTTIFTASGAATYSWSPSTGLNMTTGSSVMAYPSSAMTYTVTGTSAAGCVNSTYVNYQLSTASVVASFTSATNACTGNTVVFTNTSTNATGYSWMFESGTTPDTTMQNPVVIYSVAGTFDVALTAFGCGGDSTITMTNYITINTSYSSVTNTTICSNDSVLIGGAYENSSGVYYDSLMTVNGCDSVITVNLTVNPAYSSTMNVTICSGDSVMAGGIYQTSSGTYYDSLLTIAGCDSVITTNLSVNPTYSSTSTVMICPGDSVKIAGAYQSIPGTYNETFSTINGCDSIISTVLAFFTPPVVAVDPSPGVVCAYGDTVAYTLTGAVTYNWLTLPSSMNGTGDSAEVWASVDTSFMVVGMSADGCTDTATVSYVLNSGGAVASFISNVTTVCEGGSVLFSSTSTNATGRSWTFPGGTPPTSSVQDPMVTYSVTGNHDVTLTAYGCGGDSTITITNYITVNAPVSGSATASICAGDSILLGGSYQTGAGTYYDTLNAVNGCDSIVATTLTIKNSSSSSQTITACNSYTWNSSTYTVSGTFMNTIPNAAGCDSVMTLNLTINNSTSSTQTVTSCDSYTWNSSTYTVSGTFLDTIPNTMGCDSIMTLNLTINPLPVVTLILNPDTVCSNAGAYTLTGGTPGSGVYSGIGVNTGNFDPAVAGTGLHTITYTFTDGNGCTDSATAQILVELCTNISSASGTHIAVVIVPNPNHGQFHLQTDNTTLSGKIRIYNILGVIVYESAIHNNTDIDISSKPEGTYFLEFISNEQVMDRQIVIKD